MKAFPTIKQPDAMDCGPACLCMIAKYHGKSYTLEGLRKQSFIGRDRVSLLGISRAAEKIGFRTVGGRLTFEKLAEKAPLLCIVHWNQDHFVVVYEVKKVIKFVLLTPAKGLLHTAKRNFVHIGSQHSNQWRRKRNCTIINVSST